MNEHFKKFNEAIGAIDPESPIDKFSEKINLVFKEFQKNIGIPEEKIIGVENMVVFPIKYDDNGNPTQPTDLQKLPEGITLAGVWKEFGSFFGITKIDGKDYFINTAELAQHFVDHDRKLIIAPFFENPDVVNTDSMEKKISSAMKFLESLASEYGCKDKAQPQLESGLSDKRADFLESFFDKFLTKETPWFPRDKIDYRQMWKVLGAIETLEQYGFSPQQLINSTDPSCQPHISGEGLFSFSMINGTDRYYPFAAIYSDGKIGFVGNAVNFKNIILHEILHSVTGNHLDFYQPLKTLLDKGNEVPITVLNAYAAPLVPAGHEDIGALDILLIAMARQLSSLNNGTRFESIQQCYQPFNLEELKKLVTCQHALPPITNPSLNSTQAVSSSDNQIKIKNSQFIQRLKDQILLIEAPAITTRTLAEIICNLVKIDDKTTESIGSFTENATRLMAIGMHYGTRSMINSLAVPLLITSAKATDSIVEKAGYTPPSERFDDLMSNVHGYQALRSISDFYKSYPEPFKNILNQIVFVSLMYAASELLDRKTENEEYKNSQKLSFSDSMATHFITSLASGVLKILGSTVAKSLKSYMTPSQESSSSHSSGDPENPVNVSQVQSSINSPDSSPRNSATIQVQPQASASIVFPT
jgi:hypothetical protein